MERLPRTVVSALQGRWGQITGRRRHASYPELADQLLSGHAQGLGEGREGQLELGELLDAQVGGHGHGRDLDDLGRVLAQDVRARQVAVAASSRPSRSAGQPTAKNTASTSRRVGLFACW
jgi:hypothetical protein